MFKQSESLYHHYPNVILRDETNMPYESKTLKISSWQPLLGGRGNTLAIDKNYVAAAELARLTVWSGDQLIAQVESPIPAPGRPRFTAGHLMWGEGLLNLQTGIYKHVADVSAALVQGTETPVLPSPRGGYCPSTYAWSPEGDALVVAAAWTGVPGPPSARVILVSGSGHYQSTLWQGSDLAPKAIWAGRDVIVVGNRNPLVFNRDGSIIKTLTAKVPAFRIDVSADETRLLLAEHGQLTIWDTHTWIPIGTVIGRWLDAAISSDGNLVMAVDFDGNIKIIHVADELSTQEVIMSLKQVCNITLGLDRVAVSCAIDPAIRVARLLHIESR